MATNTQVSVYSAIAQYLFQVDTLKKNAFYGGGLDNIHAHALRVVRRAFDWGIDNNISTVSQINPYLYSLCGAKLQQAIAIYAGGNGGVVQGPTGAGNYLPYPLQIPITGSGFSGLKYYSSTDLKGLKGLKVLNIRNQVFDLDESFTFNAYDGLNGTINFDVTATGSTYTLQDGDVILSNGTYKIITT